MPPCMRSTFALLSAGPEVTVLHAQVIGHTCGKWLGVWALILTVLNLLGNGCAQVGTDEAPRGFLLLHAQNIRN